MEQAYPLQWPDGRPRTPKHKVARSRFDVTPATAQRHMLDEISRMGGRNVVVSTDQRVKRDGTLYARDMGGNVEDAGVAVYFQRKGDRVCFACDQYQRIWENMRAIGKTIEAMRAIERWGSSEMLDRAFTGFAALPPPMEMGGPAELSRPWHDVLGVSADAEWSVIRTAYRDLIRDADDTEKYALNAAYEQAKATFN